MGDPSSCRLQGATEGFKRAADVIQLMFSAAPSNGSVEEWRERNVSTEGNPAATLTQVGDLEAMAMGLEKRDGEGGEGVRR